MIQGLSLLINLCVHRASGRSQEPAGVEPHHDHPERALGARRGPSQGVQIDLCSGSWRRREQGRTARTTVHFLSVFRPVGGLASVKELSIQQIKPSEASLNLKQLVCDQQLICVTLFDSGNGVTGDEQHHPARPSARHRLHRVSGAGLCRGRRKDDV